MTSRHEGVPVVYSTSVFLPVLSEACWSESPGGSEKPTGGCLFAYRLDYASYRTVFAKGSIRDPREPLRGGLFTTCCPQESAVPKSQVRKKKVYTPPTDVRPAASAASRKPSPVWLPATAVFLIVFGIAWLVVYYLSSQRWPVESWQYWNLAVGFGCMVASLGILSRWR